MALTALLVEDDAGIREALTLSLADEDILVVCAVSGEDALECAKLSHVDVVLLDLMLPGIDGLSVCRILRERGDIPIIITTARSDAPDVIAGLEAGADDYVTKPLVGSVLAARVRALLRRRSPPSQGPVSIGLAPGIEVLPEHGVVRKHGSEVRLTRTELRLLLELVGADGRIVTREDLLARVWGYDYFGDTRLLDVHIRRLRMKVELDPDKPRIILTVRGAGYRMQQP